MNKRFAFIISALLLFGAGIQAKVYTIDVPDPMTWTTDALAARSEGDTVLFNVPVIVNRNYGATGLTVSVRRIFSPTNQIYPKCTPESSNCLAEEYITLMTLNSKAPFTLTGCGYHRNGERLMNLKAVVTGSLQLKFVSGTWANYNTRDQVEHSVPSVDLRGTHNVLVCGANLEYYLVENLGTGYGPDSYSEHQKQRTKVKKALAEIGADLYGLVEIEQGQAALAEIASDLTSLTGHPYDYINDGGGANGSYTKSGYVYRSDRLQPFGLLKSNNTVVQNRKKVQGFILIENNERFIYSINHFKAKSGTGTGKNADQGDGQGIFNYNRVQEATSLVQNMASYQSYYEDPDMLIMGDLNAYAKEDPIRILIDAGMYDLHRYFHADTSYSYVFREQAGYLDHAIANDALIKQVTGMSVWHVNSDESDQYTYDKSNDLTVFRYSDHDPVLVGLKLDSTLSALPKGTELIDNAGIAVIDGETYITNVSEWDDLHGYYEIYSITGQRVQSATRIVESPCPVGTDLTPGVYVIRLYYAGKTKALKLQK